MPRYGKHCLWQAGCQPHRNNAGGGSCECARIHGQVAGRYNTIIGERGVTLSGGQRQRIAIARAVVRNTPILILDEPSSGLDAASEKLVFEALDHLMEGKTAIVIAHRLSTIRRADVIFVVKDGSIVERGRHEDLLRMHGLYAEHYHLQFLKEERSRSRFPDAGSRITG